MTPAERAAYRKEVIRKHELQISDEDLDKDLSRHSNYETIFLKFETND